MRYPLPTLHRFLTLCAAIGLLVAVHPVAAKSPDVFTVPGAHTTQPLRVNNQGEVVGLYSSDTVDNGAFVRDARGAITTIELPDATGFTPYLALNIAGTVVGAYYSSGSVLARGFVRTPDGGVTPFDMPDAGLTLLSGINDRGVMIGAYIDAAFARGAGFVVSPSGEVEEVTGPGDHIYLPTVINTAGAIAGVIQDHPANGSAFIGAFYRDAGGELIVFDVPHEPLDPDTTSVEIQFVQPAGINAAGTVSGQYQLIEWKGNQALVSGVGGFLRHRDGSVETFAAPGSLIDHGWGSVSSSYVTGLSASGGVVGYQSRPGGGFVSYERARSGRFATVAIDGAWATGVLDTAPSGLMTGVVTLDADLDAGLTRGFIMR